PAPGGQGGGVAGDRGRAPRQLLALPGPADPPLQREGRDDLAQDDGRLQEGPLRAIAAERRRGGGAAREAADAARYDPPVRTALLLAGVATLALALPSGSSAGLAESPPRRAAERRARIADVDHRLTGMLVDAQS